MSKIKQWVVYAGVDPETFLRTQEKISEADRHNLVVFSRLGFAFFVLMSVLSFISVPLSASRVLYIVTSVIMGVITFLSSGPAKGSVVLCRRLMYLFMGLLLAFGIILGTVTVKNEITASYIALMLTVPQVFTDRPYRMFFMIYGSIAVFIVMVITLKDSVTWSSDIVNSLIFGTVSVVSSSIIMKMKVERYAMEDTIRNMLEFDQLTGVRNRYSYEQRLSEMDRDEPDRPYCIFIDVNGLHNLNDSQGHEAGDRMLQCVADLAAVLFGRENTYRVGGDEFVILADGYEEQKAAALIKKLNSDVESNGYHIAIGLSHREDPSSTVTDLVKAAEKKMYEDKSAYYVSSGADRRRR